MLGPDRPGVSCQEEAASGRVVSEGGAGPILRLPSPRPHPRRGLQAGGQGHPHLAVWPGTSCSAFGASSACLAHNRGGVVPRLRADHPALGILVLGQGRCVEDCCHQRAPELHPSGSQGHEASGWGSALGGTSQPQLDLRAMGRRYTCSPQAGRLSTLSI